MDFYCKKVAIKSTVFCVQYADAKNGVFTSLFCVYGIICVWWMVDRGQHYQCGRVNNQGWYGNNPPALAVYFFVSIVGDIVYIKYPNQLFCDMI